MSTSVSLYEKFGPATIDAVVDRFYQKILADPSIRHHFANTDTERLRRHQAAFVGYALGGPAYSGRGLATAHRGLDLQPAEFGAVVGHLEATLTELGVESSDIQAILGKLAPLQEMILYK